MATLSCLPTGKLQLRAAAAVTSDSEHVPCSSCCRPRSLTCQVVVLLALVVGQGHELPEQQRVLEHPLDGLDEVGLQGGGVLLGGVPRVQESLEGLVGFSCKQWGKTLRRAWWAAFDCLSLVFFF